MQMVYIPHQAISYMLQIQLFNDIYVLLAIITYLLN